MGQGVRFERTSLTFTSSLKCLNQVTKHLWSFPKPLHVFWCMCNLFVSKLEKSHIDLVHQEKMHIVRSKA